MGSERVLICLAGGRRCGLPLPSVVETMRPLPIQPVSGAAAAVLGVSVIRGAPTPVLELAQLLGGAAEPAQRFVTIRVAGRIVALAVEQVVGITAIDEASFAGLPPLLGDARASVIESIAAADAELLYLLEAARLVDQHMPE